MEANPSPFPAPVRANGPGALYQLFAYLVSNLWTAARSYASSPTRGKDLAEVRHADCAKHFIKPSRTQLLPTIRCCVLNRTEDVTIWILLVNGMLPGSTMSSPTRSEKVRFRWPFPTLSTARALHRCCGTNIQSQAIWYLLESVLPLDRTTHQPRRGLFVEPRNRNIVSLAKGHTFTRLVVFFCFVFCLLLPARDDSRAQRSEGRKDGKTNGQNKGKEY